MGSKLCTKTLRLNSKKTSAFQTLIFQGEITIDGQVWTAWKRSCLILLDTYFI